jgi:hypothetical protein
MLIISVQRRRKQDDGLRRYARLGLAWRFAKAAPNAAAFGAKRAAADGYRVAALLRCTPSFSSAGIALP